MDRETIRDPNGVPGPLVEVAVLIIGGGPAGLFQSYLLSRLGVQSLIIERYPERLGAPKAHALSPRSLEICRQFGLDVKRIRQLGTQRKDAYWVNFLTSLSGESVGVLPYERMDMDVLDCTPEMIHNIPQPVFEQFMAEHLATAENADICKGVSFLSLTQEHDRVTTVVEERSTGHKFRIQSKYVIACDGARSKVRECLDIESEGEDSCKLRLFTHLILSCSNLYSDETMMTIHFNANLRPIVGDRVGMLHWLFDPAASGFIIAYDLSGNAVLISNFEADKHPVESWSEELCRQVLAGAIGKDIAPKILSYRPWLLSRKVAKEYRCGNVFLAGDAAHSFPPTGGLGLNSGLADVHNLAFKIAAVAHGSASDSLLDTYESERRHVAVVNSIQSVKNGQQIFGLLKTLGTAGVTDLEAARKSLFEALHDPDKVKEIQKGVEQQREHFDNLNLHIGYVYGDARIPSHASHYRAQFVPGARLPHAWIEFPQMSTIQHLKPVDVSYVHELDAAKVAAMRYSTLDLCTPDAFTFLVPPSGALNGAITDVIKQHTYKTTLKFKAFFSDRDFRILPGSSADLWSRESGITEGGGLLIRPDQHILMLLGADAEASEVSHMIEDFLGV